MATQLYNYIYITIPDRVSIMDREICSDSHRTIDIKLFDLANNRELLDMISLCYIIGNYGVNYNYHSRGEWFCGYLSAFSNNKISELVHQKLLLNPTIRLLILNDDLFSKVQLLLKLEPKPIVEVVYDEPCRNHPPGEECFCKAVDAKKELEKQRQIDRKKT